MEDYIGSIITSKKMNQLCQNDKGKYKEIVYNSKNRKIKLSQKYSKVINFILCEIIWILIPKTINAKNYMEITVSQKGYNQIISDKYMDDLPSKVLVNNLPILMINRKVNVESTSHIIYLEWSDNKNNINAVYMFSDMESIASVSMYILAKNGDFSYMFYNCKKLKQFTYGFERDISRFVRNMKSMFYNCYSLQSFDFKKFYIDYYNSYVERYPNPFGEDYLSRTIYQYYDVDLSNMFYNCRSLNSVDFGSNLIKYISDMNGMFYNCFSLKSIDLSKINTRNNIDLSYMFYNCTLLEAFSISSIKVNNMMYMFYNCSSLSSSINLNNFVSSTYINMSKVFYNCYKLQTFQGGFGNLYINDAREMFYNCSSLVSLTFNPYGKSTNLNMSKMFYNCRSIKNVILNNNANYLYPNDLSYAFYNCTSLLTLTFNYFKTDLVKEITYMMYNCKSLTIFTSISSNFSNSLITNMRGLFQNCESIATLSLFNFYTPKVEIMWDMFKDCKSLTTLDISKFDTANVIDMESMFEGCASLVSLNLNNFKTPKVHYMNKMFSGCKKLQNLHLKYITGESLGTMHQMFYGCADLRYLNIYSLTENDQSIIEIFERASNSFKFCVKENENIPKIFEELKKRETTRDCTTDCYGSGLSRVGIESKKLCCPYYEYNGNCYTSCPPRTSAGTNKKCANLTCQYYFNYQQNGCLLNVPTGFYANDKTLKTIDMCPSTCNTCEKKPTQKKVHCLTCKSTLPYLYFGDCLSSCPNGNYPNTPIPTCKCITTECSDCSEDSLEKGLCITCASGYYTKFGESFANNYKKCYKDPPKYYFDSSALIYKPCYESCQNCIGPGDKYNHKCISCDLNYNFSIVNEGQTTKNCYEECKYYYYFNQNGDYNCTEEKKCPQNYEFLIVDLGQCVSTCNNNQLGYIMRLKKECYKECPEGKSKISEIYENRCDVICPYDAPFELVEEENCVASCSIMERSGKKCITNNIGNRTNMQMQEIIHDDIISDLIGKFNFSIITANDSVIIEETDTIYEIISTQNQNQDKNNLTSNIYFGKCENLLKEYYEIPQSEPLYVLKMDAYIEGKTGPTVVYEVFYPLDSEHLSQLDISICEGEKISISYSMYLEEPELYDKNNPIYSDICHPYSSVDGVDMTLGEKQKDYANNNKSLCEENCEYMGYDKLEQLVKCNCDVKDGSTMISDIKVDKSKLYDFMSIDKLANFDVMKCANLIIKKEYLITNIGFYSFIPTFICYFVSVIIFYIKDFKSVKSKINRMVEAKKHLEYLKEKKQEVIENELKRKRHEYEQPVFLSFLMKKKLIKVSQPDKSNNNIDNVKNNNTITAEKNSSTKLKQNDAIEEKITEEDIPQESSAVKLQKPKNIINVNNIHNDILILKKNNKNAPPSKTKTSITKKTTKEKKVNIYPIKKDNNNSLQKFFKNRKDDYKNSIAQIEKEENKTKVVLRKNDKELNELDYSKAARFDNRTFWQFYFSLLKTDHLLVKIVNSKDYNSRSIKIYLFLYNFGLSYAVNGLFFDDDAIDEIFAEGGKFNFLNQLPQIIYSSIISFAFCVILDFLALPEDSILDVKKGKVAKIVEKRANDQVRTLQIKFLFFFILSFLFMLICWYYMTCFCAVYRNTQYHLLKDTLIGFGTSMLSPFATKLIPGFFRIYGIRKRSQLFFRISQFAQMLF